MQPAWSLRDANGRSENERVRGRSDGGNTTTVCCVLMEGPHAGGRTPAPLNILGGADPARPDAAT